MQTVERLLTNAVKRFVGHIGDLALPTETQAQPLQMPEPLAHRNNYGARKAGDATPKQGAQECRAIESARAVGVLSCRHLKSSKHDLRDDRFCHGARGSSWRSQMDVTITNRRIELSKDST